MKLTIFINGVVNLHWLDVKLTSNLSKSGQWIYTPAQETLEMIRIEQFSW